MEGLTLCCLCGTSMPYNPSGMCLNCLKSRVDITQDLQRDTIVHFCRNCGRYLRPPWMHLDLESPEMLQLCLKKIKGLNKVKLIDAGFVYTEPHSRRLKVKVTIQKEVYANTTLEQTFVAEFFVTNLQCEDCQTSFTPHTWVAKVQVRQKVEHQRTFFYLEQLLLKHKANDHVTKVKQNENGLDFEFINKSHAGRFVDFLHGIVPIRVNQSKTLISHDASDNTYKYKYTYIAEIVPLCKNDLLVLPKEFNNGGIGPLVLVQKVSTIISIVNPFTLQTGEILRDRYWKNPFRSYANPKQLTEFIVLDIEEERNFGNISMEVDKQQQKKTKMKLIEVEVARAEKVGVDGNSFRIKTHLGHLLRVGDSVLGYDLQTMINNQVDGEGLDGNTPDVVLVRKIYPDLQKVGRKRVFKLERMNLEKPDKDYDEFLDELEENPELRAGINLYRNPDAEIIKPEDDTFPCVKLEELIGNLTLEDS